MNLEVYKQFNNPNRWRPTKSQFVVKNKTPFLQVQFEMVKPTKSQRSFNFKPILKTIRPVNSQEVIGQQLKDALIVKKIIQLNHDKPSAGNLMLKANQALFCKPLHRPLITKS